jgi:hypothetical protein
VSLDNVIQDTTQTWIQQVGWSNGINPYSTLYNSDCVKNAGTGSVNVPNSQDAPPTFQICSVEWELDITTPYNATATYVALSPGDVQSGGMHSARMSGGPTSLGGNGTLNPTRFEGYLHRHATGAPATTTFLNSVKMPQVIPGNQQRRVHIHGTPTDFWAFAGHLDTVDAPDAAYTNYQEGLFPRDNVAAASQFGCAYVTA